MELNKVIMIGNLTRDPEQRTTAQGTALTKFDIAVNTRRGQGKDEVLFIRVETWQKTAEIAAQYLTKGSQVLVEGRLKSEEYETKDGQKRKDMVIVADNIRLGAKAKGEGGAAPSGGYESRSAAPRRDYGSTDAPSSSQGRSSARSTEFERSPEPDAGGAGTEDDLPF